MKSMKAQLNDWAEGQGYDLEILSDRLEPGASGDPWSGEVRCKVNGMPAVARFEKLELVEVRDGASN